MILSPDVLLDSAVRRLVAARPDLAAGHDLSTPAGLAAVRDALRQAGDRARSEDRTVVAVVRSVVLPDWVRETCRFALSLGESDALAWRASFTRTVFLAGRPDNLRERFRFDHLAADGSAAWLGPAPEEAGRTLRRLLKTLVAVRPVTAEPPVTVRLPAPDGPPARAVHRDLYVAAAGLTLTATLVQLNHLLAEAVLDGLIAPGDQLTVRHVPRLTELPAPVEALRVDTDDRHPDRLRAYAALTAPVPR
ncbi:DUF6182 family protein [Kitasatospora sp. NPDC048239]|uniref:DUF6182 family protein n=1 Tax=Kitasatospora sp. NPDC048239 TaxID=3364046 RepID=UPI0037191D03